MKIEKSLEGGIYKTGFWWHKRINFGHYFQFTTEQIIKINKLNTPVLLNNKWFVVTVLACPEYQKSIIAQFLIESYNLETIDIENIFNFDDFEIDVDKSGLLKLLELGCWLKVQNGTFN